MTTGRTGWRTGWERTMAPRAIAVAGMLVFGLAAPRAGAEKDPASMTVDDIQACVEAAAPQRSTVQNGVLRTVEEDTVKESEAKLYWKKQDDGLSRALIRFSAPPDLRGSAVLLIETEGDGDGEVFMYLPEFRSVRRVTSGMMSGSMFGTDFSFEEFERLYGLAEEMETERDADAEVEGRAVFVLRGTPRQEEDSAYERIVQFIEQERCLPLRTEFYGAEPEPAKVLSTDPAKLEKIGSAWFPREVVMRDLEKGSHTTLVIEKTEVDVDIPDRTFSQRSLSRGR